MKTKNLALLLILLSSTLFAQIPDNIISIEDAAFNDYFFNKENIPTVKGRILNLKKEDIDSLTIDYFILTPFNQRTIEKRGMLNQDGTFELELDYAFPYQQIGINVGELCYTRVFANTDLFIELDAAILKSEGSVNYNGPGIKYLGADGLLNNYLNNHLLFERKKQRDLRKSIRAIKRDRKLDVEQFLLRYDSIYVILHELDNNFIEQNPSDFSWIIRNERQSDYYSILFVKHGANEMRSELFEKVKKHKSYLTSTDGMQFYYTLFTYLKFRNNKDYKIDYSNFRNYSKLEREEKAVLDSLIHFTKSNLKKENSDITRIKSYTKEANQFLQDTLAVAKTAQLVFRLDSIFDDSKSDFLKIKITSKDPGERKLKLQKVLPSIQTDWCKKVIQEQYDKSVEKLASIAHILAESKPLESNNLLGELIAETPFGAKLFSVKSVDSKTLLSNLKGSFENKALLIDFWATWCVPCIEEMPHSKTLYQVVKDLPIEFVYLCTSRSSNIEKWKSKIVEFELDGIHIFVEEDIENELMNLFSVSGFPSYVFINAKGVYKAGAISRISKTDKNKLMELMIE